MKQSQRLDYLSSKRWCGEFDGLVHEDGVRVIRRRKRVADVKHVMNGSVVITYWAYYEDERPFRMVCTFIDALERNARTWS